MSLVRPEVQCLAPYNSGLTFDDLRARHAPGRISKLGSNENPFGAPPQVATALAGYATVPHLYPDPAGRALRGSLAERLDLSADQIILGNGSEDLLSVICRAVLRPGDRMVTLYPSFPLHEDYCTVMGATVERVELRSDLTIDVNALVARVASGPRLVMFATPTNPVGAWLDPVALRRVIDAVPDGTLLVIDEAYAEYAQGPDYLDPLDALRDQSGAWIVLRTFSKAWGLAGLRIGYGLVGTVALAGYLDRVRTPFNVNGAAQAAAVAALEGVNHMQISVAQTVSERNRVAGRLRQAGYRVAESKGNFLFFDVGMPADSLSDALLREGVIVKPWKQEGYTTFLRVSIGTSADNDHFLAALAAATRTVSAP